MKKRKVILQHEAWRHELLKEITDTLRGV